MLDEAEPNVSRGVICGSTITLAAAAVMALSGCGESAGPPFPFDPDKAVHGEFSGEKAFEHVRTLVDLGPRPPGSPALERARQYIERELAEAGWTTERQTFSSDTPVGEMEFANIRARFGSGEDVWRRPVAALLGSHFDTKFFRAFRFVGANDGGSSTGLLIEAARVMALRPELARSVELVFFDGEEAYGSISATDGLYGSRAYARMARTWDEKPDAAVVFDLVGDRELNIGIPRECTPELVAGVFAAAADLGVRDKFGMWTGGEILDDHVPLAGIGMKTVNLIDLDYGVWHTQRDTLDQVSAESLETVGRTGILFVEKYLLGPAAP